MSRIIKLLMGLMLIMAWGVYKTPPGWSKGKKNRLGQSTHAAGSDEKNTTNMALENPSQG